MPEGQEHFIWTPIGWVEALEAMVVHCYRALDQPWTQMSGQRCPSGGVYMGAEGTVFGLKRQDKGVVALQTYQHPWYTSHMDGPGVERCKMPVFSPSGPIWRALRGDFGHFRLKAGRTFLTVWAEDGKLRGAGGSKTLGMDPNWVD